MRKDPLQNLKVVAVVGPTASGKSELAVELARVFNGVVISADSRQIYREMDVGTTKISREEMQGVPHYMLSIVEPNQEFSVSAYQKSVMNLLNRIAHKNLKAKSPILPLIVGGTGLYVSAIVDGYEFSNVKPDAGLRAKLNASPLGQLVQQLKKFDPDTTVDLKNKRRVIRALEIFVAGGKPPTRTRPSFSVLKIGLGNNRQKNSRQIRERICTMNIDALVKETKRLLRRRYKLSLPALSALGYRDVKDFIDKKITKRQLQDKLVRLHSQYAKRQLTWFKRDPQINWVTNINEAEKLVSQFLFD
ncbi:MAG: tRNA (adenosine(37)-N6)-dimethylallyltransferase MiaA [Patescibacteria group bacterium]|nr:tRNA (adenosine(37)-N6)-dimethylallyltransferase MiaA [Patescibacteria group bacterium]